MERRKFEDSFQEAFKNAEISPSEGVWTNIELDLERARGDQMKRRLVFFKTLAAASVVFAMCVGGVLYLSLSDDKSKPSLAQENTSGVTNDGSPVIENENNVSAGKQGTRRKSPDQNNSASGNEQLAAGQNESSESPGDRLASQHLSQPDSDGVLGKRNSKLLKERDAASATLTPRHHPDVDLSSQDNAALSKQNFAGNNEPDAHRSGNNSSLQNTLAVGDNNQNATELSSNSDRVTLTPNIAQDGLLQPGWAEGTERKLPSFYEPKVPSLQLPKSTADAGMLLLARLADEEKKYAANEKAVKLKSEKLWTSVGFAAGTFNANNPSVASPPSNSFYSLAASNVQTATKQSQASGVAYSLGVSVGTQISNRWVLQGGINYMNQSSDYTANSVVVVDNNYSSLKAESLNVFSSQTADLSAQPKVAQTFPYNVNNSVRFVSLPVQAGYLLVNRKFGVQLNAGVSTDLFLQNTITPDGGGVAKTTQGRGEDSPYRSLNFSGLMGTEFSYRLNNRYRVSLNPGLRYSVLFTNPIRV